MSGSAAREGQPAGSVDSTPPVPGGDGHVPQPRVSVVVIAHTRLSYLVRAVESATRQFPDEVVVVEFSRDPSVDAELVRLGARVFPTREGYPGGKFADGIDHCRGDVVVFLDDDDVLLPGKIARVREVFSDPEVVFHANRYATFADAPPAQGRIGPVEVFDTRSGNQYRRGLRPVIASCLTVRRTAILPWLGDLRRLTIADHSVFMMAVTERRRMAMDQSVLTGYHLNVSEGVARAANSIWARPGNPNQDIAWMLDLLDSQSDGAHATLNPAVVNAILHLVFHTRETGFHEYRRTMRALLDGVGLRRPLTVPTLLMFGYPLAPKVAVRLAGLWQSHRRFHGER